MIQGRYLYCSSTVFLTICYGFPHHLLLFSSPFVTVFLTICFCRFVTAPPPRPARGGGSLRAVKDCDVLDGGIAKSTQHRHDRHAAKSQVMPSSSSNAPQPRPKLQHPTVVGRNVVFKDAQVHSHEPAQNTHKTAPFQTAPLLSSSKWGNFLERPQQQQHQQQHSTSSKWGAFVDVSVRSGGGSDDIDDEFVTSFD